MTRRVGIWLAALSVFAATPAIAQEVGTTAGTAEVTVIPAGGTFFTTKGDSPKFGNYTYGGAVAYNVNKFVGIEGELGGTVGITQDLSLGTVTTNLKTPNSLTYNGNLVISAATGHSVVPFVTGGLGGLTMYERAELGITARQTFLTGNVGGGVKWYAPKGHWGLRGDYRFITVRKNDTSPAFFGQETRYGHRVYGAVIVR